MNFVEKIDKFEDQLHSIYQQIGRIRQETLNFAVEIDKREMLKQTSLADKKMDEILKTTSSGTVVLNVGGESFIVSLSCLKQRKNTLFYKQILRGIIKAGTTVFYDRDSKHFPTILEFMRTGKLNTRNYTLDDKEELLAESIFFEISYITEKLKNTASPFEIQEVIITKPMINQGVAIGDSFLTALSRKQLDKGFCSEPNGEIIIKFNKDIVSDEIKVAGYNGNSLLWFVSNGVGCNVYFSMTGKDSWIHSCSFPTDFGFTVKSITFPKTTFRYMKLASSDFFGIGFLDFKQS